LELDRRNHRELTTSGWWVRMNYEHASSDDVAPVALPGVIRSSIPTDGYSFGRLTLDARRYTRLTPNTRINLRLWAGGWLGGDPLPIQHRLSLGGPDLLPGYRFRAFTCAAGGYSDPAMPALCDRTVALQAEFRSRLSLGLGYQYRDRNRRELDRFIGIEEADLVLFSDAGKAWLTGNGPGRVPNNRIPNLNEWKADAGVGIDAGGIGVYLTKALTDGEPVRLFVRLRRRF
ncbi:MAG: BamA/TamA family outer membrane protein, partial [Gemmatimonadales bacterium]